MATKQQVSALIRSHYNRNHDIFHAVSVQIAAALREKDPATANELLRYTEKPKPVGLEILPERSKQFFETIEPRKRSSLILDPGTDQLIRDLMLEHKHAERLSDIGIVPRKRLLLHGPTGCGKTSIAAVLAGELGLPAYSLHVSSLMESYLGASAARIHLAMEALDENILICADEIDSIAECREHSNTGSTREYTAATNTILSILDSPKRGFLVATTNRYESLDQAFLRRMQLSHLVPSPNDSQKRELAVSLCRPFMELELLERELGIDVLAPTNFADVETLVTSAMRKKFVNQFERESSQ